MNRRTQFKKALRFIAEEKAFLKFEIKEGREYSLEDGEIEAYINEQIKLMILIFKDYDVYPRRKWVKRIKYCIHREWRFIKILIKNLKK